jgi:hypothetical protein
MTFIVSSWNRPKQTARVSAPGPSYFATNPPQSLHDAHLHGIDDFSSEETAPTITTVSPDRTSCG